VVRRLKLTLELVAVVLVVLDLDFLIPIKEMEDRESLYQFLRHHSFLVCHLLGILQ
jgi:hypothetical protein